MSKRVAVLALSGATALTVAIPGQANAALNDGVYYYENGEVADKDEHCFEERTELGTTGGCDVDYQEAHAEFRDGTPTRVSADGVTCPDGSEPIDLVVTDTVVTTSSLSVQTTREILGVIGAAAGAVLGQEGLFKLERTESEKVTTGYYGPVRPGNIGSVHFVPKLLYTRGTVRYTDDFGHAISTEVDALLPVPKRNGFSDGAYVVHERPMNAEELKRHCGVTA